MSLFNSFIIDNYIVTNDISIATHWKAKFDPDSCVKSYIIPNKEYPLIKEKGTWDEAMECEEEYFIRCEDGCLSMYYLCHDGEFIIKEK